MRLWNVRGELITVSPRRIRRIGRFDLMYSASLETYFVTDAVSDGDQLTERGEHALRKAGLLPELFSNPAFADVMPSTDSDEEAAFIFGRFESWAILRGSFAADFSLRMLDVGCGTGRLLTRLQGRGLTVDGVDTMHRPLASLAPYVRSGSLFVGDIEEWRAPGRYNFAFAALNTLRYLGTRVRLMRHLESMWVSVQEGGCYLVHIAILVDPYQRQVTKWSVGEFSYEWATVGWDRIEGYIEERARVWQNNVIIADEIQIQVAFDLQPLVDPTYWPGWSVENVWNDSFEYVDTDASCFVPGNYWLELRKV